MNPYQQGQDAYKDGKEPRDCPYGVCFLMAGSRAKEWLEGWLDIRETYQGERGV